MGLVEEGAGRIVVVCIAEMLGVVVGTLPRWDVELHPAVSDASSTVPRILPLATCQGPPTRRKALTRKFTVGLGGIEPPTSALSVLLPTSAGCRLTREYVRPRVPPKALVTQT